MANTKLFKIGNSQAVRIPAELALRTSSQAADLLEGWLRGDSVQLNASTAFIRRSEKIRLTP
jgi:antitoxin component of MazEF toxin-antitoxin module